MEGGFSGSDVTGHCGNISIGGHFGRRFDNNCRWHFRRLGRVMGKDRNITPCDISPWSQSRVS